MNTLTRTGVVALLAADACLFGAAPSLADLARFRIATQEADTVSREIAPIWDHSLDANNGFEHAAQEANAGPAAQIAVPSGAADVILSGRLWVARQRAERPDFVILPCSLAVRALQVLADNWVRRSPI